MRQILLQRFDSIWSFPFIKFVVQHSFNLLFEESSVKGFSFNRPPDGLKLVWPIKQMFMSIQRNLSPILKWQHWILLIYLGYKTSKHWNLFECEQKQNPQIWLLSWKSETYCYINCATRRYFFWWSVSESCDLKWPAVFSGFMCFLPIRWRTDL